MTLDDIPLPLRECLAVFEALRRCGFSADDIYFTKAIAKNTGRLNAGIQLQAQGLKYTVTCGELKMPDRDLIAAWQAACAWWKSGAGGKNPDGPWRQLWEASFVYKHKVDFLATLISKGFTLPVNWN